jgi:hypothetical protein
MVVVTEHSAEPCSTMDGRIVRSTWRLSAHQTILQPLMIALLVEVEDVLRTLLFRLASAP